MRRFLIVALVLGLGFSAVVSGCSKGDKGGGSGGGTATSTAAPSLMEPTSVLKSDGTREYTFHFAKDKMPVAPDASSKVYVVFNESFAAENALEPKLGTDGRWEVTKTLPEGHFTLRVGAFAGSNLLTDTNGRPIALILPEWNSDVKGLAPLTAYKGDVFRRNTKSSPWLPGNEGHGPIRFTVKFGKNAAGNDEAAFNLYLKLPDLSDQEKQDGKKHRLAASSSKWPVQVNPLKRFTGWYEPENVVGNIQWSTATTTNIVDVEVAVVDTTGTKVRAVEFPDGNDYLKSGTKNVVQFAVYGSAFVRPALTAAATFERVIHPDTNTLLVPIGGKRPLELLGEFKDGSVVWWVNMSLNKDITAVQSDPPLTQNTYIEFSRDADTRKLVVEGKGGSPMRLKTTFTADKFLANPKTTDATTDLVIPYTP